MICSEIHQNPKDNRSIKTSTRINDGLGSYFRKSIQLYFVCYCNILQRNKGPLFHKTFKTKVLKVDKTFSVTHNQDSNLKDICATFYTVPKINPRLDVKP